MDKIDELVYDALPQFVKNDLMEKFNEDEERVKQFISTSSRTEIFDTWLKWNGIIGYTTPIVAALDGIESALNKRK